MTSPTIQCKILVLRHRGRPILGRDTFIHPSVQILGRQQVAIGNHSVLSQDCWLNVNHRHNNGIAIQIGANCFIGRRNFFSSGAKIILDDFVLTAHDCQFLGSTHIISDPMYPVLAAGTTDTDIIVIGANTFVGAGACILGNIQIGHGCVIGARSVVTHSIPPFSLAHGTPASVKKRYSIALGRWIHVDDFTELEARAIPLEDEYKRLLNSNGRLRMPYIAAGSDMGSF